VTFSYLESSYGRQHSFTRIIPAMLRHILGTVEVDGPCSPTNRMPDLWQLGNDVLALFRLCEFPDTPDLDVILDLSRKSNVKDAQGKSLWHTRLTRQATCEKQSSQLLTYSTGCIFALCYIISEL
jgi:hypothetical protein